MKQATSAKKSNSNNNDVGEALALLSETLGEEETRIRDEGADAMKTGAYETARDVIDFAERLIAFQNKVAALADEWEELENAREAATPEVQKIVSKHFFGKKKKGLITPQDDYCQPILEVLVEMGGGGKTKTVLDRVGEKMNNTLKPIDYESHKSNDKQIRWRNTAQWARNKMVNSDGRMKKDSPNGVWEISDKGRKCLKRQ
ncbi:MAG TPA: winged helix-turn-helix domain-containing protein [Opitutales bacterium]|nr:winged helix-turn-helix domain-containing protein [Opitutales bacterium]